MDFGIKSDVRNLVIFLVNLNTARSCIFFRIKKTNLAHCIIKFVGRDVTRLICCLDISMLFRFLVFHAFFLFFFNREETWRH